MRRKILYLKYGTFLGQKSSAFLKNHYIIYRYDRRYVEDLRAPSLWQTNSNYSSCCSFKYPGWKKPFLSLKVYMWGKSFSAKLPNYQLKVLNTYTGINELYIILLIFLLLGQVMIFISFKFIYFHISLYFFYINFYSEYKNVFKGMIFFYFLLDFKLKDAFASRFKPGWMFGKKGMNTPGGFDRLLIPIVCHFLVLYFSQNVL